MKTKYNLTKSELRIQVDNQERLKAAGVTIGPEEADLSEWPALRVDQSERCMMTAYPVKGFTAEICLRLIPTKPDVILRRFFDVTIPGCNDLKIVLPEPTNGMYKALGHVEYARAELLNDHFLTARPLSPNRMLCGIVLAYSFEPLPGWFKSGMMVEATVSLMDQLDNVYRSTIELNIERHVPRKTHQAAASNSLPARSRLQRGSSPGASIAGWDTKKGEDIVDS
jgi:hypothetical protein